jgi:hypothetical protein
MALDLSPPSAWNGSWDDAEDNPSAAGAVSAIACAIGAARACAACERTSCKRQVSGSNPLTGSQVSGLCGHAAVAEWDVSTRQTNEGFIRRTIKPALGPMKVRKVREGTG